MDDFPLKIPTFSARTDYRSKETQDKLRNAINEIGLCYYEMTEQDKKLYSNIYPKIMSFFGKTINDKSLVNQLPKLREFQKQCINYGYVDKQKALFQLRSFVTPFEEFKEFKDDKLFINDSTNPFQGDKDVVMYAQNMIKYCQSFFPHVLACYLNENGIKYNSVNEQVLKIMGKNPCKHLRFNYYDPVVAERNKKIFAGVHTHSDYGMMTFLKPGAPGFQAKYEDGWKDVPYFEDRFVVNFGKALQITTDYGIKAVPHKVPVITDKPRISIAFFYDPDIEGNLCQYQLNGQLKSLKDFRSYFYGDMFAKHGKIAKNAYKNNSKL